VRFECDFAGPDDRRQQVTIPVELTPDEVRVIRMLHREGAPHVEVTTKAYALKHAYAQAPDGYQHIQGGVRQVLAHSA
jgi:hypothetical protein